LFTIALYGRPGRTLVDLLLHFEPSGRPRCDGAIGVLDRPIDRCPRTTGDSMVTMPARRDDPAATAASNRAGTGGAHRIDVPLRVSGALVLAVDELHWRFSRSSGPGGQGVNTADSRVELSWNPSRSPSVATMPDHLRARLFDRLDRQLVNGEIVITVSEHRAQLRNRETARRRLLHLLQQALGPPPANRRPSRPTRGSIERRIAGKKARGQVKASRSRPGDD
jgi:ribosome-associated protein